VAESKDGKEGVVVLQYSTRKILKENILIIVKILFTIFTDLQYIKILFEIKLGQSEI